MHSGAVQGLAQLCVWLDESRSRHVQPHYLHQHLVGIGSTVKGTGARRGRGGPLSSDDEENSVNAHRPRYESTSPTGETVWHGRSSGDDALWSDIAYSDVVRVWPTQDSTIGLAQDQSQAVHRKDGTW